ncbi:DUF7551 domain-containing protein [Halobaculum limi]|uniref:DUF7551 domain-containing protein n=1 Tax=Halobaculum limi TaxID=3031916 RepID=UPI0024053ABE|nr:hypothetical protein [Halobaculum sp. YSMS11]
MIGTTLCDLRRHIESLANSDGAYRICCARTGATPIPVVGLAFERREVARAAIRCAEQYRAALRRYDPSVPVCDLVAVECPGGTRPRESVTPSEATDPTMASVGDADPTRSAVEFCHTVAGVVFEAIADSPHLALQDAIMDEYLDAAEAVDDPDDLCLQLLRSIATELETRLDTDERLAVLRTAGSRMATDSRDGDPAEAVLERLRSAELLRSYTVSSSRTDGDDCARRWQVELDGYALADGDDARLVTLPVVVGLFAHASATGVVVTDAAPTAEETWRATIETNANGESTGLTEVRPR